MSEGKIPPNKHGLIPMLVAIRVAGERRRRAAEAAARGDAPAAAEAPKTKKKRGWFG